MPFLSRILTPYGPTSTPEPEPTGDGQRGMGRLGAALPEGANERTVSAPGSARYAAPTSGGTNGLYLCSMCFGPTRPTSSDEIRVKGKGDRVYAAPGADRPLRRRACISAAGRVYRSGDEHVTSRQALAIRNTSSDVLRRLVKCFFRLPLCCCAWRRACFWVRSSWISDSLCYSRFRGVARFPEEPELGGNLYAIRAVRFSRRANHCGRRCRRGRNLTERFAEPAAFKPIRPIDWDWLAHRTDSFWSPSGDSASFVGVFHARRLRTNLARRRC